MPKQDSNSHPGLRLCIYFTTFALLDRFFLNYSGTQTLVDAFAWTMITFGVVGLFSGRKKTPEDTDKETKDPGDS